MTDLTSDYLALRREAGAVPLPRDVLRVAGPQAVSWLHSMLSQDVESLAVGSSALSFVLQPQGKLVALVRVTRATEDEVLLDTDPGWGGRVVEHLARFKLRTKADLDALDWRSVALRGPGAREAAAATGAVGAAGGVAGGSSGTVAVVDADWPGLPGVDLLGPDPAVPDGVRVCDPAAYEAVRIEAGVPVMGREADASTTPHELGLVDRAASLTKGCYTGQELVARVDSRGGHAPRFLRGVLVAANVIPPVGATLHHPDTGDGTAPAGAGGKALGRITSVAESLDRHAPVALSLVARAVEPPADVEVVWDGGRAPARVEQLPLVS